MASAGAIIPWNAPGPLTSQDVAPAIAMGNTIVLKPAEDAPLTPLLMAKLALEAGIPAGVVNVVCRLRRRGGRAARRASARQEDELHRISGDRDRR